MNIKLILLQCISYILFISCATKTIKIQKPFLWEARKDDKTLYIFGTMHSKELDFEIPEIVKSYINNAEVTYVEVNESDKEIMLDIFNKRVISLIEDAKLYYIHIPFKDLFKALEPKTVENLKYTLNQRQVIGWYNENGIKTPRYESSPELILLMTRSLIVRRNNFHLLNDNVIKNLKKSNSAYTRKLNGNKQAVILDTKIKKYASTIAFKPVHSLDDLKELEELIVEETLKDKDLVLRMGINKIENFYGERFQKTILNLAELKDLYITGNEVGLNKQLQNPKTIHNNYFQDSISKEFRTKLLKDRNETWLEKILNAQHDKIFIAGGAYHFIGPHNLLEKLKNNGFTIKRIETIP